MIVSHHATHLCYGNRDWRARQTFSRHRDLKPGLWDDSIDSSVDASARLSRPALRPMVNDNIVFNNSSSYNNSVDATEGRVTFKWRNAKEDTFGALFCWCEIQTAIKNIQDSNWHCPNFGYPDNAKKYVVRALHSTFQPNINQPTHINQPTLMLEICHTRPSTNHFRPNSWKQDASWFYRQAHANLSVLNCHRI